MEPVPPKSPHRPEVIVEHLSREQFRAVYPLVREAAPTLSLPRWLDYARRRSTGQGGNRAGIITARRHGVAHPSGVVCYRRERNLAHGTTLTAEHVVALDLLYPEAILGALIAELERLAVRLGCATIRSILRPDRQHVIAEWNNAGHRADGITLTKAVAAAGAAGRWPIASV